MMENFNKLSWLTDTLSVHAMAWTLSIGSLRLARASFSNGKRPRFFSPALLFRKMLISSFDIIVKLQKHNFGLSQS